MIHLKTYSKLFEDISGVKKDINQSLIKEINRLEYAAYQEDHDALPISEDDIKKILSIIDQSLYKNDLQVKWYTYYITIVSSIYLLPGIFYLYKYDDEYWLLHIDPNAFSPVVAIDFMHYPRYRTDGKSYLLDTERGFVEFLNLISYTLNESFELKGNLYRAFPSDDFYESYESWLESHRKITPTNEDVSLIRKMEPHEYVTEVVYMRDDGYERSIINDIPDANLLKFHEIYIRLVSPDKNITFLKFEDEYWVGVVRSDNNNNHYLIDGIDGIRQLLKDI